MIFLSTLSKAINAYLKLDQASHERIKKLAGQVVTVELLPMHFVFQCRFTQEEIVLKANEEHEANVKICGTPIQLLNVMMSSNRQQFFADDITIEGNAELAQQVIELFDTLQIDWEEQFSHLLGDIPAYHANRLLRNTTAWLKQTRRSFTQNVNDYLHEEILLFPTREALNDLFSEIDTLRMDVDRIELRVKQLMGELAENRN